MTRELRHDPLALRRQFAARFVGEGVEIGPGHAPTPVPPAVKVRYLDRWLPAENSSLFPELGDSPGFAEPDIVADLDVERLSMLEDESQDFVIASHILEHLANPLAMIVEIDRVLKVGGLLVLLLPDRHLTFDRFRSPTPLAHLVDEYTRDVREVDDAHILDYVIGMIRTQGDVRDREILVAERTPEEIAVHRRRSVHAHVWDMHEFEDVLRFARAELGVKWKMLDVVEPGAKGAHPDEFGWLLSRAAPSDRTTAFAGSRVRRRVRSLTRRR